MMGRRSWRWSVALLFLAAGCAGPEAEVASMGGVEAVPGDAAFEIDLLSHVASADAVWAWVEPSKPDQEINLRAFVGMGEGYGSGSTSCGLVRYGDFSGSLNFDGGSPRIQTSLGPAQVQPLIQDSFGWNILAYGQSKEPIPLLVGVRDMTEAASKRSLSEARLESDAPFRLTSVGTGAIDCIHSVAELEGGSHVTGPWIELAQEKQRTWQQQQSGLLVLDYRASRGADVEVASNAEVVWSSTESTRPGEEGWVKLATGTGSLQLRVHRYQDHSNGGFRAIHADAPYPFLVDRWTTVASDAAPSSSIAERDVDGRLASASR